jgi:hypothetical protein
VTSFLRHSMMCHEPSGCHVSLRFEISSGRRCRINLTLVLARLHHVSYGTNGPDLIVISPCVLLGSTVQISPRSDGLDHFVISCFASWKDRAPRAFDLSVSEMPIARHVSSGFNGQDHFAISHIASSRG